MTASLHELLMTTKRESLKVHLLSALTRICRQSPQLIFQLLDKTDAKFALEAIMDSNSKIQQHSLTLLNATLFEGPPRLQQLILEDKNLVPT